MVNVRAYSLYNRMIVHFFDTGSKDTLRCPECSWQGVYQREQSNHSSDPEAIQCPRCAHALGILTQPISELCEIPAYL